jgi:hypothetical protein
MMPAAAGDMRSAAEDIQAAAPFAVTTHTHVSNTLATH